MKINPINNPINNHIATLDEMIKKEKSQGKPDYNKIAEMLLSKSVFLNLNAYNNFRENLLKTNERIHELLAKIQENYNDPKVKHMQRAAGALAIIGGAATCGGSGIGGFVLKDTVDNLSKAQGVLNGGGSITNGIGQGLDKFSSIDQTAQDAQRKLLDNMLEETKRYAEEERKDADNFDRQRTAAENALKEKQNADAAAARAIQ